jgi:hypothetical protein
LATPALAKNSAKQLATPTKKIGFMAASIADLHEKKRLFD